MKEFLILSRYVELGLQFSPYARTKISKLKIACRSFAWSTYGFSPQGSTVRKTWPADFFCDSYLSTFKNCTYNHAICKPARPSQVCVKSDPGMAHTFAQVSHGQGPPTSPSRECLWFLIELISPYSWIWKSASNSYLESNFCLQFCFLYFFFILCFNCQKTLFLPLIIFHMQQFTIRAVATTNQISWWKLHLWGR